MRVRDDERSDILRVEVGKRLTVVLRLKEEIEADDNSTAEGHREAQGGLDESYQFLYRHGGGEGRGSR